MVTARRVLAMPFHLSTAAPAKVRTSVQLVPPKEADCARERFLYDKFIRRRNKEKRKDIDCAPTLLPSHEPENAQTHA